MGQQSPKKKARVICLHGFPGRPSDWDELASSAGSERDIQSIPMPWLSAVPALPLNLQMVLEYCRILIDENAQEPVHLVGHDLGGLVLWWLAQSNLKDRIASLSILSCPHPLAYAEFTASPDYASRSEYIDDIIQNAPENISRRIQETEADAATGLIETLKDTDIVRLAPLYTEILASRSISAANAPKTQDIPFALINSFDDRLLGAWAHERSVVHVDGSVQSLLVDGQSHFPHLTSSQAVNSFLKEFWNGTGH